MRSTEMMARRLVLIGFAAALATALGCSNGSDTTNPPGLACADGGQPGADVVAINCVAATDSTTEQVRVMIGGPAAGSTTLRGLNFDVTYDPAHLEFVPAGSYTSPLFPGALVAVSLSGGQQGRVVISIQQVAGSAAASVAAGSHAVLDLSFRTVAGVTFAGAPLTFENAEATTASAAIAFTSGLALSYQ
jgi:hypothetical protein